MINRLLRVFFTHTRDNVHRSRTNNRVLLSQHTKKQIIKHLADH